MPQDDIILIVVDTTFIYHGRLVGRKSFIMSTPLPGLANAQSADSALTTEIATYIEDVATKIQEALASTGDSDAAVQQIATDLLADAANLKNADPVTGSGGTNSPVVSPPATS
jgi:hypothetical protein